MNHKLIRLCRHFPGLTQKALAEELGVSTVAVCKFEAGTLKPSPEALRKMKAVFAENGIEAEETKFLKETFSKK